VAAPVGQVRPPVTRIGRLTPAEKSSAGGPLAVPGTQGPLTDAGASGATVTVQDASPEIVVTTPACGMVMVPVEPAGSYCRPMVHGPLAELDTVRAVVNSTLVGQAPPLLLNVAGVRPETRGPSGLELAGSAGTAPVFPDSLQVTGVVPTRNVAVVPAARAATYSCPAGVTVVASAARARDTGRATVPAATRSATPADRAYRAAGVRERFISSSPQKHSSRPHFRRRERLVRLNLPAEVAQATCLRPEMVTRSACWLKKP